MLQIRGIGRKLSKHFIISKYNAGLPILRVETNFASGILPKVEQGRILHEENNWGHVLHVLIKDCLIPVASHL